MSNANDDPAESTASDSSASVPEESPATTSSIDTLNGDAPYVVILTGLSGSGKSTAVNALEDLGFFCIDNLPVPLLPKVLELATTGGASFESLAFVIDTRERMFLDDAEGMIGTLRDEELDLRVVFLEADEETLVRRYSETRRRHPMSDDGGPVREAIRKERDHLSSLRELADQVVDTSDHTVHSLKSLFQERYGEGGERQFAITVLSFGFKHGLPSECDLVFDLRFLPNPYFVDELRDQDGRDEDVQAYVLGQPETGRFISHFQEMAEFVLPLYESEGKSYLTIGIGCTGGRHRSVAVAEALQSRLRGRDWDVQIRHRDVDR